MLWHERDIGPQVLMKQKEAQAIRRLIQEKDAQDRGMGREQLGKRQPLWRAKHISGKQQMSHVGTGCHENSL